MIRRVVSVAVTLFAVLALPVPAAASGPVGTTFPPDFPTPTDEALGVKVLGFGAQGQIARTPLIFLHGNNDTPYPTSCNSSYGKIQRMAQYFHDRGYALSELWGLGYQGDQCDLQTDQSRRSAFPHTTVANVPDLRAFVSAVLAYTGATQVDLVGHSYGVTLSREFARQDNAYAKVRSIVGIDGPEHGIINCSPSPLNYYVTIGFNPNSEVCKEVGSDRTPFLLQLNAGDETPGPTRYLVIRNADTSFVYFDKQDGVFAPVPAQDREGNPHDFSQSAKLAGAQNVDLTGQGQYDETLLTAHLGIIDSPETWKLAFDFLVQGTSLSSGGAAGQRRLAATGGGLANLVGLALLFFGAAIMRSLRKPRVTELPIR